MKKFLKILVNHKWAIILAILIGMIIAFPQAYFRWDNKDIYQGVDLNLGGNDELFYFNRIQEIRDGHLSLANPIWAENKDSLYLQSSLPEIISAFWGQIFGLSLFNGILLQRFIFPIIISLFIYIFIYCLTKRRVTALSVSITVLLSINLVDPLSIWNLIINQKVSSLFLSFSHIVSPQNHLFFFFGFLMFFWLFLEKKKWIYGIISSIILGFSFYTYPYTWTFICTFLGLLIIIFICRKLWLEVKNIILISIGGLIIAIPFFWNLFQAVQHPMYLEMALRFGMIKTHMPQVGLTIVLLLGLFLLFFPRSNKKIYDFFLALVIAPFIVLNQQIITGQLMIPDHYHWYFHKPLVLIIIIIILFSQIEQKIKKCSFKKILFISLFSLILLINFYHAVLTQVYSYKTREASNIWNQRYGPIFQWLNNHAQKDEVAMTNNHMSHLITIYTSLNSATAIGSAHYYIAATEDQLWQRMFLEYRFDKLKKEEAFEVFSKNRAYISGELYGEYYRKGYGAHENIPDKKIYAIAEEYGKSLNIPLEDILRKYQVKYLVWDIELNPNWLVNQYSFMEQIYQSGDIRIYEVRY